MNHRMHGWLAATGVLYLAVFTVLATMILLVGSGLIGAFQYPVYQWWLYAFEFSDNPAVREWLWVSGLPAAGLTLLGAVLIFLRFRRIRAWTLRRNPPPTQPVPSPIRGTTDNHGHARWATMAEARALWPVPASGFGGVVVGEAYDPREDPASTMSFSSVDAATWGRGGKAPLLIDRCDDGSTHSLIIAGSGAYKTTSAVSTLLNWTGSAVVLDPAGELGPMLIDDRQRMGHRVFILSLGHAHAVGFNVLDWIDINSPMAETDIGAVVEWICGHTPADDATAEFFKGRGKALIACLLAHMVWDPKLPAEQKTLRTLRAAVVTPEGELRKVLAHIHRTSASPLARDLAGTLKGLVHETFSGLYANADEDTKWLSTRAYADLVSGDSFKTSDITSGTTDVFVALPLKTLQTTPAIARCIIGSFLNSAYEADGKVKGRILFELDEAARLGPMSILEIARDAGRKYGVTLQLLYQSVGQIVSQWGADGKRAWFEAVSWRAYAAVQDLETAKELSGTIGDYGVLAWSEALNTGLHGRRMGGRSRSSGKNVTYTENLRPLIRPEEIMHDLREDAQIVIPRKGRPVLCGRAIYFRRPEFKARVGSNRFFQQKEEISG
jgi:type IV secretion system protein VirD4